MGALYTKRDTEREHMIAEPADLPPEPYRHPWRRDYARLIHSPCFRRLQGKTQLFPGLESDFFRNRLTHSLEVAQIAKSIAVRLNSIESSLKRTPINPDLVEIAGLAHDLGHPPFGHNGEKALDDCMKIFGGFEGNAQTLRILARLEKRDDKSDLRIAQFDDSGRDLRIGLNLTYRTLAAVLKYDRPIPVVRKAEADLVKGYYDSEKDLVLRIKQKVLGSVPSSKFKTVECQIMDVADDIAYSTYDLEDAFKAGFTSPLDMLSSSQDLLQRVAVAVDKGLRKADTEHGKNPSDRPEFTPKDVIRILLELFSGVLGLDTPPKGDLSQSSQAAFFVSTVYRLSEKIAANGYMRAEITSAFVGQFIRGVRFSKSEPLPLSNVYLEDKILEQVEVLKNFTYCSLIGSSRLKVAEHRGYDIVHTIFTQLAKNDGDALLPDDYRECFSKCKDEATRKRVICDFVAGMTDRYAVEFYGRLKSENAQSIFKPI